MMQDRGDDEEGRSREEGTPDAAEQPGGTRTWTERYAASPSPNSPFYSPPPSSRSLRWLVAIHLGTLAVFTVGVIFGVVQGGDVPARILVLLFWALFAWWRGYQIRLILKELARRREAGPGSPPPRGPGLDPDADAEEKQRQRKAAWARVGHDVFPLLSNPTAFKRPFGKRNDFKD